jgi:hypothetical protein
MTFSSRLRAVRRRHLPESMRGKPLRRIQREVNQRLYRWPHRNLLIVGLPKSGTTWLLRMIRETPGYVPWQPPVKNGYENHDVEARHLSPPPAGYTVSKTHTRPIESNIAAIHGAGRPYVIQYRDLRDVSVSWAFYARNTPGHHLHHDVKDLDTPAALSYFIERLLPDFVAWTRGWTERLHPTLGLVTRYEDLLRDTPGELDRVLRHYGVALSPERIAGIVERHAFKRATGRAPGQEDAKSFNRKGISGDWVNHFTVDHKRAFKDVAGQTLIDLGYATDLDW